MDDYYHFGKIAATHGLTGEVIVQHALGTKTELKGLATIFIEEGKATFLPYFIEGTKAKNTAEIYVKLEGYNTPESAKRLVRRDVWMLKKDFDNYVGKSSPLGLLGFTMINEKDNLGEIVEVIEQPMQVLCKIIYKGKEALIPIHEKSLLKIDRKKKLVYVQLPDGLLEIYDL